MSVFKISRSRSGDNFCRINVVVLLFGIAVLFLRGFFAFSTWPFIFLGSSQKKEQNGWLQLECGTSQTLKCLIHLPAKKSIMNAFFAEKEKKIRCLPPTVRKTLK